MQDARKAFVVDIIAGAIAPQQQQKPAYAEYLAKDDSGAIAAFLDDSSTSLLQVSLAKSAGSGQLAVRLANTAAFPKGCFYQLMLTKVRPGPLHETDLPAGVLLSTVVDSPVTSLYHSLNSVFCPMLKLDQQQQQASGGANNSNSSSSTATGTQQQHAAMDPQLGEMLLDVQAGLARAVRGAAGAGQQPAQGPADNSTASASAAATSNNSMHGILSPLDELHYWADLAAAGTGGTGVQAQVAAVVLGHLDPLQQQLFDLQSGTLPGDWEGALELVGRIADALRKVWTVKQQQQQQQPGTGWAYPQARMQHFMRLIGSSTIKFVQHKLQGFDLWRTSFSVLKGSLISAAQLLRAWSSEASTLCSDWAMGLEAEGHLWQGGGYADTHLAAFQDRIEQIYGLRELHEELSALFSQQEAEAAALGLHTVLEPFARLPALHVSAHTAAAWESAHKEHERRLGAVEERVSQKLKELFATIILPNLNLAAQQQQHQHQQSHGMSSTTATATNSMASSATAMAMAMVHPQQLFQELMQHSRLLSRPSFLAALQNEQLALAQQIDAYIEALQEEFDHVQDDGGSSRMGGMDSSSSSRDGAQAGRGQLIQGVAHKLSRIQQCQAKATCVQDVLELLGGSRPNSSSGSNAAVGAAAATSSSSSAAAVALRGCLGTVRALVKAMEASKKDIFVAWQDDTLERLREMASWKTSRLMSFDAVSSHIRCHFNELLVGLMREARQLQGLGYRMKSELAAEVDVAAKFYRYGMVLQQCAHFYNNIATEMIPCQKPMMLAEAVEFEKVFINPKDANNRDITWHNSVALEGYVKRLSAVAERLAVSNRQLKQWHRVLAGKVAALMSTDLVRHKDKWVSVVKEMREVFARLEAQGYPRERQELWRQHWDFQLYKALDVQYRMGLESINKTLPEMDVSLVVRNHKLQYDPPLEELRLQHLTGHLQPFLALPLRMKGVSSLSDSRAGFFGAIATAYPAATAKVYESCEALFGALADETQKYSDWLALGEAGEDLSDLVERQVWGVAASSDADSSIGSTDANNTVNTSSSNISSGSSSGLLSGDADDKGLAAWELNIKSLKTAAYDLGRLPNEVRIDVYCVRLGPLKAYVEEMIKRLREALAASLRKRAMSQRQAIEDFIAAGTSLLNLQASSSEEIGRAGQEARRLVAQLGDVSQLRKRIEDKNRLLRQLAAAANNTAGFSSSSSALAPVDPSGLAERWDGFVGQLQVYDSHLEGQRAGLQQQLAKRIDDFAGTIAGFASRWQAVKPRGGPAGNPSVILVQLDDATRQLQDLQEEAAQLAKECEALGVTVPALTQLDDVAADVAAVRGSWVVYQEFLAERDELAHRDWLSMRDQVWKIEDFLTKWEGSCSSSSSDGGSGSSGGSSGNNVSGSNVSGSNVSGSTSAQDPGKAAIALVLLQEIDKYRQCLPHLKSSMRGVGWQDSHWAQLFGLLGFKAGLLSKESVTLSHFLDKCEAVVANAEAIKALDATAQGESVIRKALTELQLWGLQRSFAFVAPTSASDGAGTRVASAAGGGRAGIAHQASSNSNNSSGGKTAAVPLIKDWGGVLSEVGDHQSLVASLKTSPYYSMFKDEAVSWETRLATLLEGLTLLQAIQRRWLYLQPIFGRGALPTVAGRFRHVDGEFRAIMLQLQACGGKVVSFAQLPRVLERLGSMSAQLESCQRALNEFLEDKRAAFPRFYFLGDDDLLEVLGQGASLPVIQPHLRKLFAGIHRVRCSADQGAITAMASSDGEVVDLVSPVTATEAVESWLHQLTDGMRAALQASLRGVTGLSDPFTQAPAQVLGLYHALSFTERVESAITSGSLPQLASQLRQELATLAAQDYSASALMQLKKQGLIIDMMHSCNVVEGLLAPCREDGSSSNSSGLGGGAGVPTSPKDWAWTRQLKYYASADGQVSVSMAEANLSYSWEYAGNAPKLVVTPLTDRCFLTLTQALALGYGGNPYGPAGTGKTESVKALGLALGRQVLVFNCDEEFDVRAMGRIFVGLLRCGAWGCFDEFNRLGEDVLSAVSQQVQAIQTALKEGAPQLDFMGKAVQVNVNAGLFVTLNPAGKGYGGRSKLPDNLQQMFRPIAMTVPDNDLIAEVLLASEGFASAKTLASKLVALYSLAQDGLSRQQHYDWGLRALKTALGAAGRLLRQLRKSQQAQAAAGGIALHPPDSQLEVETGVVVRAVCATKLPTLTFQDVGRFRALIADIFPGASLSDSTDPQLEAALVAAGAAMGLQLTPQQVERMLQLHLACEQRIGVIILGPSGSGKSTLWQVLEAALERLGAKPIVHRMNPKAMPRQQLLGSLNLDTREWADGVLTAAARKVAAEPPQQRSWIVADGDVDPEWIESLNSVLDDNRLLTMPNGERIQFGANVNLIFECDNLTYASPATVSRCGLMYLSEADIEPSAVLTKWLTQHPAVDPSGSSATWFNQLFPRAYEILLAAGAGPAGSAPVSVVLPSTRFGLLENALSQLVLAAGGVGSKKDMLLGLARGLGFTLAPEHRQQFVAQLARLGVSEAGGSTADLLFVPASEDPLACLLDMQLDQHQGLSGMTDSSYNPAAVDILDHPLMLTDDVRSLLAVLAPWLASQQPFLLAGPEGCGKSLVLDYCFSRLPGRVTIACVHCSAQMNAYNVLQKLLQVCGKPVTTTQGKCLRPDSGRVILYLKGINLPKPDKYETSQVVAFVQQLLSHGGYYDDTLDFIRIERIQVVASIVPEHGGAASGTSGGRSQLSKRLVARLKVAVMGYPDAAQLEAIYTRMLQQAFGDSKHKQTAVLVSQAPSFARAMLQVYHGLQQQQLVQQSQSVGASGSGSASVGLRQCSSFTPRDLTSWVEGLKRYDLQCVDAVEAFAAEGLAVFGGRLPDGAATKQLQELVLAALRTNLGYRGGLPAHLFTSLGASQEARLATAAAGQPMPLVRRSVEEAQPLMAGLLKAFEREVAESQLLLFPQALERITALDRCLSVPGGAVLLYGPCGSGRRSLLQLVAHAQGLRFWSPAISRLFDAAAFRSDLKEVLRTAGIEGSPVLLFLEERHLAADPGVLEVLNCLLSAGEVPGLFSAEELSKELAALDTRRDKDVHYQGAPTSYAYFTACLHRNLRVAVSLDPSSEAFSRRLEQNPALLSCCSMLWWQGWSDASLTAIAQLRLQAVLQTLNCSNSGPASLISHLLSIHQSAEQQLAAAPRQFLACAELFESTIVSKRGQLLQQQTFLKNGLRRLAEATVTIDELSQQAQVQRALLAQKQEEADHALADIQSSMEVAADRRREVELLRQQLGDSEGVLQEQRGQVEAQLAGVQPLIDAARTAVGGIKADNINEVRSLRMPSEVIRDVLEGVLLLMGQEDTSWVAMKTFLGKRSVKEDILNYDAHRIINTPGLEAKLERLMVAKGSSFEREVAYRASQAAGPLAVWVVANLHYSRVLKQIAPLEGQLDKLKGDLSESQGRLQQCQEELMGLDQQVCALKLSFQQHIREAEALKLELGRAEATLTAATDLLSKLSGERSRWEQQLSELDGQMGQLPLAALLLAAFVTYLPAHPEDVRARVLPAWASQLGLSPDFSPIAFLSGGGEAKLLTWQGQGLPSDTLSAQNALAILHGVQTPFIIDPSSQAIDWLRASIKASGASCEVVAQHDPHFINSLELAVRFGTVLVVSEVDRVHPVLYPLLRRELHKQAGRLVVSVGEHAVDHNPAFKLYLVTRNTAPALTPDVVPLLTVTNFSITRSGLESQLLSLAIQHEQPELEARKAQLLQEQSSQKLQLSELEKQLLQALATSSGNLLGDTALLSSLNEAKAKALSVAAALDGGRQLAAQLDQQRNVYRPLAAWGSTLYFSLLQLRKLDNMYCFSLTVFLQLFKQLFHLPETQKKQTPTASGTDAGVDRNALLSQQLLLLVHSTVSRAMFNRDHLSLALHLARHLLPAQFAEPEWAVLLSCSSAVVGGGGSSSSSNSISGLDSRTASEAATVSAAAGGSGVAVPSWVGPDRVAAYEQIASSLPELVTLARLQDSRVWAAWAETAGADGSNTDATSAAGGVAGVPVAVSSALSVVQQLVLVAAFHPESFPGVAAKLVCQQLQLPSLHPAPTSMRQLAQPSDETTTINSSSSTTACAPVLFVTTAGADPSQELSAFAEAKMGRENFHEVAMGQGQAEVALQLLKECAATGGWLLLKNLHLVVSWLPALEREIHAVIDGSAGGSGAGGAAGAAACHPGFRLFLASQPHAKFPQTLLERSVKVVFEAPPGIKQNIQRTYAFWSSDFLAGHAASSTARRTSSGDDDESNSSVRRSGGVGRTQLAATPANLVPLRAQMLFMLAWFNAVLQERQNYVPIGWTTPYDFSVADLRAAADVVAAAAACGTSSSNSPGGGQQPDWEQLLGLLQVIYGGRVSSKQDTKVLLAHLLDTFSTHLLPALPRGTHQHQQQQRMQTSAVGMAAGLPRGIALPSSGLKQDWLTYVSALPDTDQPAVMGLPANIQRSIALSHSRRLLASLRHINAAQVASGSGLDLQQQLPQLQPVLKLWEQLSASLPPALRQLLAVSSSDSGTADHIIRSLSQRSAGSTHAAASTSSRAAAASTAAVDDASSPVAAFVALELEFGVSVLRQVASTLSGIQAALSGEGRLATAAVQASASALSQGQVPHSWDALWEGPASPLDYMRSAVRRAVAMESWHAKGCQQLLQSAQQQQQPLDLSTPFRPAALLNALEQQACREAGVALGQLKLASYWGSGGGSRVANMGASKPPFTVLASGLLLQGALFDGYSLQPVQQHSPLVTSVPAVSLTWVPVDGPQAPTTNSSNYQPQSLSVPLYSSLDRQKVVAQLQLPLASAGVGGGDAGVLLQQQWTLAGVALMLPL